MIQKKRIGKKKDRDTPSSVCPDLLLFRSFCFLAVRASAEGVAAGLGTASCLPPVHRNAVGNAFPVFVINTIGREAFDARVLPRTVFTAAVGTAALFFKAVAAGAAAVLPVFVLDVDADALPFAVAVVVIRAFNGAAGNFRHVLFLLLVGCDIRMIPDQIG